MSADPTPITAQPLMTTRDVAHRLAISETMVKRLAAARKIRAIRIGKLWRFTAKAVDEYIESVDATASTPITSRGSSTTTTTSVAPIDFPSGYVPVFGKASR